MPVKTTGRATLTNIFTEEKGTKKWSEVIKLKQPLEGNKDIGQYFEGEDNYFIWNEENSHKFATFLERREIPTVSCLAGTESVTLQTEKFPMINCDWNCSSASSPGLVIGEARTNILADLSITRVVRPRVSCNIIVFVNKNEMSVSSSILNLTNYR